MITRLVDRDMAAGLSPQELERLELRPALMQIARVLLGRAHDPEAAALFRICVTEAVRFPELAAKMRENGKIRVEDAIASYFMSQIARGTLNLTDPAHAAGLFVQMVCSELHQCVLFGSLDEIERYDPTHHLQYVLDIFLLGSTPRSLKS